ncbi:hypothetical protein F4821DRAFT_252471 [Hypoxylon rubiginosum]|uniref:Uncharacterized protein n=1 Tax=Hypoxylon rubiginosum TaxID=110542 RepID=A0ACC0DKW0_9PEZI|nr:hypothetical protein F4821DRAFT_252471 [Hypoxylon rubiginosum]
MNPAFNHQFTRPKDLGKDTKDPKHLTIINYAPFAPYYRLNLQKNAYKARDLLNATVAAFHRRDSKDLSGRQNHARKAFLARFTDRQRDFGGKPPNPNALAFAVEDVRYLAKQLDRYFFFGLVTDHIQIWTGFDVVGKDPLKLQKRIEGSTLPCSEGNRSWIQINLNIGSKSNGNMYHLDDIVGQLMHEMIHAYLQIYACDCWKCERDSLNTVGVDGDGHGPVFLMLHRLILTEMRKWHDELKDLLVDDCPRSAISKSAWHRATAAMRSLDSEERRLLNPVRANNFGNYLVRFNTNNTKVYVNPSLITKQLKKEAELKTKRKIKKLNEDWFVDAEDEEEYSSGTSSKSTSEEHSEESSEDSAGSEDESGE